MGRKVFVVGAHLPAGGARMAHWVGRVAQKHLGFELVCVKGGDDISGYRMFDDPEISDLISPNDIVGIATKDDLLVCNPSFSELGLGRYFPGKSVCYAQGFSTYSLLDHFDVYVSVSRTVQSYLENIYSIKTSIIPPFIEDIDVSQRISWNDKRDTVLVSTKGPSELPGRYLEQTLSDIRSFCPGYQIEMISNSRHLHKDMLKMMAESKYLLSASAHEGFGLMPLEAMARGCVVTGLNGVGGRDYMKPEVNCSTLDWIFADQMPKTTIAIMNDEIRSLEMSEMARMTASEYRYQDFETRWLNVFRGMFG